MIVFVDLLSWRRHLYLAPVHAGEPPRGLEKNEGPTLMTVGNPAYLHPEGSVHELEGKQKKKKRRFSTKGSSGGGTERNLFCRVSRMAKKRARKENKPKGKRRRIL